MMQLLKREFGDPKRRRYVFFAVWKLVLCTGLLFIVGTNMGDHSEYRNTVGKKHDYLRSMYPTDPTVRDIVMNDEQLEQKRRQLSNLWVLEYVNSNFLKEAVEPAIIVGFGGYAIDWLFKNVIVQDIVAQSEIIRGNRSGSLFIATLA